MATESAGASLRYGFVQLRLATIVAIVHPKNRRSRRVIDKLGMGAGRPARYFGMQCLHHSMPRESYFAVEPTAAK